MENTSSIERQLEYISTQVERIVDQFRSPASTWGEFRKVAMLSALTFEEEMLPMKVLGFLSEMKKGEEINLAKGLLTLSEELKSLLHSYRYKEIITDEDERAALYLIIGNNSFIADDLRAAWSAGQSKLSQRGR